MLATKPKTCRCGNAGLVGPLSWSDVREIQDDYGVRPTGSPTSSASPEAEVLHVLYTEWVDRQGINPERQYVMPLCSLLIRLTLDYGNLSRRDAARTAQRILVDGLNDEDNGLEVVLCPSRALRTRKRP